MSCSGIDIYNPYSWIIFSGLMMGVAFTGLLKKKRRNWSFFSFFLSGSMLLALLGLFLPGPEKILNMQLLFFFIGSGVIGIGATWFWKSAGLLIFLLLSFLVIFVPIALRPWQCVSESVVIGSFRLVSQSETSKTVELDMSGEEGSSYFKLDGGSIEIEMELLTAEEYYFFLKARRLYRVKGGMLIEEEIPAGLPGYFSRLMANYHSRIPGISFAAITSGQFRPEPLTTYVIKLELQNGNGLIRIERLYL